MLFPSPAGAALGTMTELETKKVYKQTQDKDHARIRWVWRCNAAIDDDEIDQLPFTREDHAMFLYHKLEEHCSCFAFQLESAPTTGYLHYQGYMELGNKKRKKWILANIRPFEYVAPSKGTPKQAWNYATKEDTRVAGPWTFGAPFAAEESSKKPTQLFVEAVCAGATDAMLVDEHPSCFLRNDADKIRQAKLIRMPQPNRMESYGSEKMVVFVFYGDPGTGKSYTARELYPGIYTPPIRTSKNGNFWLTTAGNLARYVLIDDFDGNMTLKALNQMLDPYPQLMEKKGGDVWWMPEVVILTTNVVPGCWYNYDARQNVRTQVNRRITMCFDFNTPGGKALREGISVAELEERYKVVPKVQLEANVRMAHLPPVQIQVTPPQSPVIRKPPSTPRKAPYVRPEPRYSYNNVTRTLSVYKPLVQRELFPKDGGEVVSWEEIDELETQPMNL